MTYLNKEIKALEKAGYTVTPPPPPIEYPRCAFCDTTSDGDYMCSVTVITNPGEEGYDQRTLLYCEMHNDKLAEVLNFLVDHGFGTHHHGSTHFLTDHRCEDAFDECPTPEESPYEREEPSL